MTRWGDYYNHERPHSALDYLRPVNYYRGDPAARLAERKQKLAQALETRKQYWQAYANVNELLRALSGIAPTIYTESLPLLHNPLTSSWYIWKRVGRKPTQI